MWPPLGSACIEVWITEEGETRKIVFSGDVGNINQPIIKDPMTVKEADYVVIDLHTETGFDGAGIPDYVGELYESDQGERLQKVEMWSFHPCGGPYPGGSLLYPGDQGEKPAAGISGF